MKKISKISALLFALCAIICCVFLFAGCEEEEAQQTGPVSDLRGTFTFNDSIGDTQEILTVTTDPTTTDGLYTERYPFSSAAGQLFNYRIAQQLRLNRDRTYSYICSVVISNPQMWGNEFGRMEASVTGTFTFVADTGTSYTVSLSAPTGGWLELYGIGSNDGSGNYWNWRVHEEPDVVQDYDYADCFMGYQKTEVYQYVDGRDVTVDTENNSLSNELFDPRLFDLMAKYGTY